MTKRDSNIIKGIAILCMFFHHLFGTSSGFTGLELTGLIISSEVTVRIANLLKVCVAIFALVSGYGLYVGALNAENKIGKLSFRWILRETLKRYWGIIKDIWVILPLMIIFTKIFGFSRTPSLVWKNGGIIKEIKGFAANMTATAGIFHYKWFVTSWWYLGIAVIFVIVFPIIYWLMRHIWSIIPLMIVCVIPFVSHVNARHDNIWRYLPAFVLGMFLADTKLIDKLKDLIKQSVIKHILFGIVVVALYVLTLYLNSLYSKHFIFQSLQAALIAAAATAFLAVIPYLNKALEVIGRNSKYMWLIHVYIYGQVLGEKLFALKNIWIIWTVLLIISLAVSVVLKKCTDTIYAYIERIFGKIKSA